MSIDHKNDETIAKVLHEVGEGVKLPETLLVNIKKDIKMRQQPKERIMMKRKHIKWVAVCAMMLMVSTVAYAVGNIESWVSHTDRRNDFKEPPTVTQMEEKVGFAAQYPLSLNDEWQFDSASVAEVEGQDVEGNTASTYQELSINYLKDGSAKSNGWLTLNCHPLAAGDTFNGEMSAIAVGETTVDVYYNEQAYKFVPPSYELTDEDKAAQESGKLAISYGTENIEEETMRSVVWQQDGIYYHLLTNNDTMTQEALLAMAVEAVNAK